MPTDRTAAHVAAIQKCAAPQSAGNDCDVAWDTAALTRVVEQIAAAAMSAPRAGEESNNAG